jgi:hypothetical protein
MAMGKTDFSLFLVTRVADVDRQNLKFTVDVQEKISEELMNLFREVRRLALGNHLGSFLVQWDPTPEEIKWRWKPNSAVVYFVREPERSLLQREGVLGDSAMDPAGRTGTTSRGVLSEAYVRSNFPAKKLAHIAFHELMHNKLDIGSRAIQDLHKNGGGGLADSPTTGIAKLTPENARLMAANLHRQIKQNTKYM